MYLLFKFQYVIYLNNKIIGNSEHYILLQGELHHIALTFIFNKKNKDNIIRLEQNSLLKYFSPWV